MKVSEKLAFTEQKYVSIRIARLLQAKLMSGTGASDREKKLAEELADRYVIFKDYDQKIVDAHCEITGEFTKCLPLLFASKDILGAVEFSKLLTSDEQQQKINEHRWELAKIPGQEIEPFVGVNLFHLPNTYALTSIEEDELTSLYSYTFILDGTDVEKSYDLIFRYEEGILAQFEAFLKTEARLLGLEEKQLDDKLSCVPDFQRNAVLLYGNLQVPFCETEDFTNPITSFVWNPESEKWMAKINLSQLSVDDTEQFVRIDLEYLAAQLTKESPEIFKEDQSIDEVITGLSEEYKVIANRIEQGESIMFECCSEKNLCELFCRSIQDSFIAKLKKQKSPGKAFDIF